VDIFENIFHANLAAVIFSAVTVISLAIYNELLKVLPQNQSYLSLSL